ncbi:MAG TPA: hypothetical protein VEB23_10070 [Ramlibacter sp.]|nr:hypothetical protein [Ramlibacter sp.]
MNTESIPGRHVIEITINPADGAAHFLQERFERAESFPFILEGRPPFTARVFGAELLPHGMARFQVQQVDGAAAEGVLPLRFAWRGDSPPPAASWTSTLQPERADVVSR